MKDSNQNLIQVVYCSTAATVFTRDDLNRLLEIARRRNKKSGITGMLLYAGGSFFQVLEGKKKEIDKLIVSIEKDNRHNNITIIIQEPVATRSFSDWTMGYADVSEAEVEAILGTNDFLSKEKSLSELGPGRARKLLDAFMQGHWRAKINGKDHTKISECVYKPMMDFSPTYADQPLKNKGYSYAFQPIINRSNGGIFSYEALIRGVQNESAMEVLNNIPKSELHNFDERSRLLAIHWAANLGLCTHLNLNIMPTTILNSPSALSSVIEAAETFHIKPRQIVLEILESDMVDDLESLSGKLRDFRSSGLLFAIDDFGAGYAGLNLLAEFQPDFLKLDLQLVRNIERKGPRQAIIRGIYRTCLDLGIEIIAEGVETKEEYCWLSDEGIELFQGYLFSKPAFEELPVLFSSPA